MGVQLQVLVEDATSDLTAFVVVDSLLRGRAMGGTRMTSTVTLEEVAGLARRMTQKLTLADIPIGGAKAGIVCGLPPGPDRDRRLADFGRAVAPLLQGGIYLGSDQGVSHRDRDVFFASAGYDVCREPAVAGCRCPWPELWRRCEDVTGFGVCEGIAAAAEACLLSADASVVIQGFGSVGRGVATGLSRRGFRVVAVADRDGTVADPRGGSLPLAELLAATDDHGGIDRTALPDGLLIDARPEGWLDVEADLLVLAAAGDAVHAGNVGRVRVKLVVEAGNFSCTAVAHRSLAARGVPVLPDFVINVGGAAVTGLMITGEAPVSAAVDELVDWLYGQVSTRIRGNVQHLLGHHRAGARPLAEIAEQLAAERLPGAVTAAPAIALV
jgi:glutamate dehydrogenase (NAD(P)+)